VGSTPDSGNSALQLRGSPLRAVAGSSRPCRAGFRPQRRARGRRTAAPRWVRRPGWPRRPGWLRRPGGCDSGVPCAGPGPRAPPLRRGRRRRGVRAAVPTAAAAALRVPLDVGSDVRPGAPPSAAESPSPVVLDCATRLLTPHRRRTLSFTATSGNIRCRRAKAKRTCVRFAPSPVRPSPNPAARSEGARWCKRRP